MRLRTFRECDSPPPPAKCRFNLGRGETWRHGLFGCRWPSFTVRVNSKQINFIARPVTAPLQFKIRRDHALEQVSPYRCHMRCRSDKGLTRSGITNHGQCHITPHPGRVRIGWITPAQPNLAAGSTDGSRLSCH